MTNPAPAPEQLLRKISDSPRASVCLNIPKTATSFSRYLFQSADLLQTQRCLFGRSGSLFLPEQADLEQFNKIKKHFPFYFMSRSNLNSYLKLSHVPYARLSENIKKRTARLTCLREATDWYISWLSYDLHRRSVARYRLQKDIGFLLRKNTGFPSLLRKKRPWLGRFGPEGFSRKVSGELKARLLNHRQEFIERFGQYTPKISARDFKKISLASYIWYVETFWITRDLSYEWRLLTLPRKIGWLTYQAIAILFENPRKIFSMSGEEFDEYFASHRYRQDIRCDYFLDQRNYTRQLGELMTEKLGYEADIVAFLQEGLEREGKKQLTTNKLLSSQSNWYIRSKAFPAKIKAAIKRRMDEENIAQIISEREKIYIQYIYPLRQALPG